VYDSVHAWIYEKFAADEERRAPGAICRRRKVDALTWKRARAFPVPAAGEDAGTVSGILDIGPTVLTEWRSASGARGLPFFGPKARPA